MAKKYDCVATTGTYQKDGETKYLSKNVGSIIETKHGFRLKLDASFNPAGCPRDEDGSVWIALFEPKPRDSHQQGGQKQGQNNNYQSQNNEPTFNPDDDVPW